MNGCYCYLSMQKLCWNPPISVACGSSSATYFSEQTYAQKVGSRVLKVANTHPWVTPVGMRWYA